ncbi:MAG: tRNA pseudouridine(55) synthase TruB [Planctomycetaceae bacterium]|nr:tRNA pseudouridine(55) synthase TruB [Planctomycetaceae bacterium]
MLLNIHKPSGRTSRDVVDEIQRLVYPLRCGHAGTLDPLATGVLVVCIDSATRLVPFLHELPKTYRATFLTGCRSDTDDVEGDIEQLHETPAVTRAGLQELLPQYLGDIMQVPPRYSAVKVQGKRAYTLARTGQEVEIQPRTVSIHHLQLLDVQEDSFSLEVECGTGTYIRSLGRDLAVDLGSCAVMSELARTSTGLFRIEDAVELDELTAENWRDCAQPLLSALPHLPRIPLEGEAADRAQRGQPLTIAPELYPLPEIQPPLLTDANIRVGDRDSNYIAAIEGDGELLALLSERNGRYWPRIVFPRARRI